LAPPRFSISSTLSRWSRLFRERALTTVETK
jgi:hypothetical protein